MLLEKINAKKICLRERIELDIWYLSRTVPQISESLVKSRSTVNITDIYLLQTVSLVAMVIKVMI